MRRLLLCLAATFAVSLAAARGAQKARARVCLFTCCASAWWWQTGSLALLSPPDSVSCDGFCGGQSPFGCFCDDLCTFYDDCCPDAIELCLTPPYPPPVSPPPAGCALIPGDVNGDGEVSVLDLVALSNSILGLADLPEGAFCAGDVDSNGVINVADVVAVVTIIVG